ncbi:MAG: 2-hydroxyacyl-CoA dehydratase [Deltaproteobacteria bacterium]|nr:2-hydroxyacyl-CoA dehydratase [Deltaproteobacteria bacterium]
MNALDELMRLPDRKENPYLREWKEDGGRVVGFACGYVPEEIIHAAGLFPYRMEARGATETGLADIYMHRFNCTFSRCLLQTGLSGEYDFLDGFCLLNGCEQIRRLYEIWEKHLRTDYLYMVTVPHSLNNAGLEWYEEEIHNFKEHLTHNFGVRCSSADLTNSIRVYNESRRLIDELYELRKAEAVPTDALKILLAAGIMPREKFNELLREALDEVRQRAGVTDYKARLMIGGSALDDAALIGIVEGLGGMVVTDSLCFGSRHFMNPVAEDGDPVKALADRYYYHNPCPRMLGEFKSRERFTEELARGADVDGLLLQKIVFCDNHAVESTMLAEDLEPKGIPTLILEREYMLSDVGRLKTRIEAFLERIARR